ncbi:hypothetical protein F2Q69_00025901 [Brassica cretica]|uniref:Uncharacterized protein n=1 Tax=Brassica cretica TaxID=69181 RepID=A0A8S9RTG0_BRACR|nr:hypothetical protein F2Q69_00025901 [Brassica cretica]
MYCKVPISGKREVWEGLEDMKEILGWEGGERVGDERDLLSEGLDGRETEREFEAGGMSLGQWAGMEGPGVLEKISEEGFLSSFSSHDPAPCRVALSSSLANVLAKNFDSCIERYPHLYGGDARIHACVLELGVRLSHEPGFHQFDVNGNALGILTSYPTRPLVSLHHMSHIDPLFPNSNTFSAIQHLFAAVELDPLRIFQLSVCYDRRYSWTISVSWGYTVQIESGHMFLRDVLRTQQTFRPWQNFGGLASVYTFNTREFNPDPCERPVTFFMEHVSSSTPDDGTIKSVYKQAYENCTYDPISSPRKIEEVRVFSTRFDPDIRKSKDTINSYFSSSQDQPQSLTDIDHIVFGIGSSLNSWPARRDYVKLWWDTQRMRGCVFVDQPLSALENNTDSHLLPPICVSDDTSRFRYTCAGGDRRAIRIARCVLETVRMFNTSAHEVRWYVFGDDDTIFIPENLARTLSKYDHRSWYYIGATSEIYESNRVFGNDMAFGGGGIALSSSLANVLAKNFDSCIERYPYLYGGDSRIHACVLELGVGLSHDPGFHQNLILSVYFNSPFATTVGTLGPSLSPGDILFRYTCAGGDRRAIRIARCVLETVRMFNTSAHEELPQRFMSQNRVFGNDMAFGGGGIALSSSLANVLAENFDSCIERYPYLYRGDSRIDACVLELGVGLSHEPGFHQFDLNGNALGILTSHSTRPLVSLHHMSHLDPLFPNSTTFSAVQHLFSAVELDPLRILQLSVCYDRRYSWTISVSWGYTVQIESRHMFVRDVLRTQQTFRPWQNFGGLAKCVHIQHKRV